MRKGVVAPEDRLLPATHQSLARGVRDGDVRGVLHVLTVSGGIAVGPKEGRSVLFGRNRPEVHVCVGEDDRRISRRQGVLTYHGSCWWISSLGRVPLRLPGSRLLFKQDESFPLAAGYTPVFVRGSGGREHLVEVHVRSDEPPRAEHTCTTQPPGTWALTSAERLALVVLSQRYLLHEPCPSPLSWRQAAQHLSDMWPEACWTQKKVEHLVGAVRKRLSRAGIAGLTKEEVGEPVGNMVNHNLIRELLESGTLVPPDLSSLICDG
ncbi:FHA domain-containing protein [Amycolatopsis sp. NPDC059657]|uniref:FHA domain-containing protein n=1 Tax=Amycolatopsis sp. NPDC059657 TaxID=3346899 RepID=UPI00366CAEF1